MSHFILDCDPGHDDAVAMLIAARHLNLVGVTTVFGNSTVENTTRNAITILDAAGLSHIPVAMGAESPLRGTRRSGETVHGKTGLNGANLPSSSRKPVELTATEFIREQAEKYDDLIVIAVAPETNIATALTDYPGLKKRIRQLSIMGGSTHSGNATAAAEFNIWADPEAAAIVFDSGIPITLAGLNVTTSFGFDATDLSRLRKQGVIAREIGNALSYYYDRQHSMYERDFAPVHDLCAVIPFSHPHLITHLPVHVVVECDGKYTRGMTVCDQRGVVEGEGIDLMQAPNAEVAFSANGKKIIEAMIETLNDYP